VVNDLLRLANYYSWSFLYSQGTLLLIAYDPSLVARFETEKSSKSLAEQARQFLTDKG